MRINNFKCTFQIRRPGQPSTYDSQEHNINAVDLKAISAQVRNKPDGHVEYYVRIDARDGSYEVYEIGSVTPDAGSKVEVYLVEVTAQLVGPNGIYIVEQPTDSLYGPESPFELDVVAEAEGEISYQWQYKLDLSASSWTTPSTAGSRQAHYSAHPSGTDTRYYRCRLSVDGSSYTYTNIVTVEYAEAPELYPGTPMLTDFEREEE